MDAIDENDKYFGEYLRKNRCKLDGHSFKSDYHSIATKNKDVTIDRSGCRPTYNYGFSQDMEKFKEIEVTDLDEYFDIGFVYPSSYCKRTFNTLERWEDVQTLLNENAVKITKEFNRYNGSCRTHYDIPVTGHFICENYQESSRFARKKNENPQWFYWKGKYYDPSMIYFHHSSFGSHYSSSDSFTPICPLKKGYSDDAMKLGRIEPKLNRIAAQSYYCPSSTHLTNPSSIFYRNPQPKKNVKNQKDYLEFDLGQVYELTNIGTLGGYPKKITLFHGDNNKFIDWTRKRRRRRYRRKYINIVNDPQYLCWVKRYSIFYRDLLTGKWIFYESFEGNHDIPTEVCHKISILARYIRVVPLEFQNAKDMRVLVYGEPHSTGDSSNSVGGALPLNYKGMTKREKRQQREVDERKDKDKSTIRYTLTPGTTSNLIFDGYPSYRRYHYGKQSDKKRIKYALISDEFDAYCDERYSTD